jgi:hypothetical protein
MEETIGMVSFIKETKTMVSLTWLILAFYGLYALFGIGFNGLLFSMAVGLIAYSVVDSMLIVAASVILSGILWRTVIAPRVVDTFADVVVSKLPDGQEAYPRSAVAQIVKRVTGFGEDGVQGVGSKMTEGFADVNSLDQGRPDAGSAAADKTAAVSTGSSTQASTKEATATATLAEAAPSKEAVKEATAAAQEAPKTESVIPTIGVQSGKPDETKRDGFHVDAASTLMNALNTLDTKTIENMTADTRNLLETQKSLMGMLQSMKPLLSDSQNMMSTFNSMFGPASGAGAGAGAGPAIGGQKK